MQHPPAAADGAPAAAARVAVLRSHLAGGGGAAAPAAADEKQTAKAAGTIAEAFSFGATAKTKESAQPKQRPDGSWSWKRVTDFLSHMDKMEVLPDPGNLANLLPGPLRDSGCGFPKGREEIVRALSQIEASGQSHVKWMEMQRAYGGRGLSSNLIVPLVSFQRGKPPVQRLSILLHDPQDCARIAQEHILKQPNFGIFVADSIISTRDNAYWRRQRQSLTEAFTPFNSLAHIFPISARRARIAGERMGTLSGPTGDTAVDLSEFMLHEAMAQLELALFGFDEAFMEKTNKPFRDALAGRADGVFIARFLPELLKQMKRKDLVSPSESLKTGRPVHGPLSRLVEVTTPDDQPMTKVGNAMIFAFAGHDTTGHTMTWLIFEMAKNPALQRRVQAEVDELYASLAKEGRDDIVYRDLSKLPFLTRCITETLRLWAVVPNGTFRELEHDDWVTGPDGGRVAVPAGTFVQVCTWSRHHDPELWGEDVLEFKPDRDFTDAEIWGGRGFSAKNPWTHRFSPFVFPPRDCIGKNFSQMEMRAILCNLFRRYTFELAEPTTRYDPEKYLGLNYATLGPQDLGKEPQQPPPLRDLPSAGAGDQRVPVGLYVHARPRR